MQVRGFPKTPQWESPVSTCLALALARMQARGFPKIFSRGVSGWTCVSPWRLQGCKLETLNILSRGIFGWTRVSPWHSQGCKSEGFPKFPKGNFRLDMCIALALSRMPVRGFPKTPQGEIPVGHMSRLRTCKDASQRVSQNSPRGNSCWTCVPPSHLQGCKSEGFPKLPNGNLLFRRVSPWHLQGCKPEGFPKFSQGEFPVGHVSRLGACKDASQRVSQIFPRGISGWTCAALALDMCRLGTFKDASQRVSPNSRGISGWTCVSPWHLQGCKSQYSPRGISGWTCVSPWHLQGCKPECFPKLPLGSLRLHMCLALACKDASQRLFLNFLRGISVWTCVSPCTCKDASQRVSQDSAKGNSCWTYVSPSHLQGCKSEGFPKLPNGKLLLDMCLTFALARMQVRGFPQIFSRGVSGWTCVSP